MSNRPGGIVAGRPLHFIWIADCSGSMALDGKMEALNTAIREALPHMRQTASENPNAKVFLQTLRFSSGAQWTQPEPVSVESFRWQDLQPDELPMTAEFAAEFSPEFRERLMREGAQTGDVQISLKWHNYNDLDLHVICPSGEEIAFTNRRSACGGELDVDENVSPNTNAPVENVFWPSGGAPMGRYQIFVHHYNNHNKPGCTDPTRFEVGVKVRGHVQEFSGSISYEDTKPIHEFILGSAPASTGPGRGNTDLGRALAMVAEQLKIPPMASRALPPVLVLISDGQPTDAFEAGLITLNALPWGKKAVRIAIAIGTDADLEALTRFMGHSERQPLMATNAEQLVRFIRWASTAVLQSVSAPPTQPGVSGPSGTGEHVPIPVLPQAEPSDAEAVW